MARPRKFEDRDIIEKVIDLFWEKGYEGASMDELARVTGLKRGSLYNAFGTKYDLFLLAIEQQGEVEYGKATRNHLQQVADDKSALAAVQWFFDLILEDVKNDNRSGCFIFNVVTQQAPADAKVESLVQKYLDALRNTFKGIFQSVTEKKKGLSKEDAEALADTVMATYMGLCTYARVGYELDVLQGLSDVTLSTIKSYIDDA